MSSFGAKIECLRHQDPRSKRAAAVISAAKALGQQRLQVGLVGAVSPTPLSFIDEILADETFVRAVDCLPQPCTILDLGNGDGRTHSLVVSHRVLATVWNLTTNSCRNVDIFHPTVTAAVQSSSW